MRAFYIQTKIGDHRHMSPEGYLIATSIPICRTGWQDYRHSEIDPEAGDETVRVYRSPDEVFSPATIASFEAKSITSPHPPQFLTVDNDLHYGRGHVQNVRRGSEKIDGEGVLLADLVFKDATLIDMINSGVRDELSCGYNCEWIPVDDPDSPLPSYRQQNIRGNHIAVVPTGRAGEGIRVLDHATVTKEEPSMLENVLKALGWKEPASAVDSDPGAVERNIEAAEKAKERAIVRNKDEKDTGKEKEKEMEDGELENEEKEAKEPSKKVEKEFSPGKDAMDAMETRLTRKLGKMIADGFENFKKGEEKEEKEETEDGCTCGAEKGEAHDDSCAMHESEDSDLIPVETLTGKEVPENPIPGSDAAKVALDALRAVREVVASSGDKKAMDSWNEAVRKLKGTSADKKANYGKIADRKKPDDVEQAESLRGVAADRSTECSDFESTAKKFHRKNANEVSNAIQ